MFIIRGANFLKEPLIQTSKIKTGENCVYKSVETLALAPVVAAPLLLFLLHFFRGSCETIEKPLKV